MSEDKPKIPLARVPCGQAGGQAAGYLAGNDHPGRAGGAGAAAVRAGVLQPARQHPGYLAGDVLAKLKDAAGGSKKKPRTRSAGGKRKKPGCETGGAPISMPPQGADR